MLLLVLRSEGCFQSESATNVLHVIQHPHVIVIFFFFPPPEEILRWLSRFSLLLFQLFFIPQFETFNPNSQSADVITLNLSAIDCKSHFDKKQAGTT